MHDRVENVGEIFFFMSWSQLTSNSVVNDVLVVD